MSRDRTVIADGPDGPCSDCPGCGAILPGAAELHRRSNASEVCWQLYGEVAAYELAHLATLGRVHQLLVDTYGAQHAGGSASRMGVAFALIGLRLSLEEGWSGDEIQDAHRYLAAASKPWPEFAPHAHGAWMTVSDVANATSPEEHARSVHEWAASVWAAWGPARDDVVMLTELRLPEEVRSRIRSAPRRVSGGAR
jgi:hypothetical protein